LHAADVGPQAGISKEDREEEDGNEIVKSGVDRLAHLLLVEEDGAHDEAAEDGEDPIRLVAAAESRTMINMAAKAFRGSWPGSF